jgi:predicted dehydrogenase
MTSRRDFLKTSALAGTGLTLAPSFAFRGAPNEKVVLGVMGVNSRGLYLAEQFAKLKNAEVGFICDVDEAAMNKAIAAVEKITGKRPKGIKDVRQLLEVKDLDALAIAAPDHWHAPAAIMACQAGKHVYVEKPCAHNPAEGEMLVEAARKHNRLVQMGSQRRSFPSLMEAMQSLREGVIGRVYFAKGWYANNRKPIGVGKAAPVPAGLDFDLWQGPAPRREFKDNLVHYNWHWFWHWGTGEALNNGTHEIDVMRWGLGVDFPTKVSSGGGRFAYKDDWETPDTQTITFEFPNNTAMTWEGRSCNNFPVEGAGRGTIFYGERGSMVIPGGAAYKIYDEKNKVVKEVTSSAKADAANTVSATGDQDAQHLLNFVEAVRDQAKLTAPIAEGHKSTLLPQLGNIAYRVGRVLNCDPTNGHILNDKEASKLWSREYEKGWKVVV